MKTIIRGPWPYDSSALVICLQDFDKVKPPRGRPFIRGNKERKPMLNKKQVAKLREMKSRKMSYRAIGAKFGMSMCLLLTIGDYSHARV